MYTIDHSKYGLRLRLAGRISSGEAKEFFVDICKAVKSCGSPFAVFVDLRELLPLRKPEMQGIVNIHRMCLKAGANRSVVILNNPITMVQFKRLALETNVFDFERYIDASANLDWETTGLEWLIEGVDPDAERREEIARRRSTNKM